MSQPTLKARFGLLVLRNTLYKEMEYRSHYYLMLVSLFISFAADFLIIKLAYGNGRQTFITEQNIFSFVLIGLCIRSATALWGDIFNFEKEIRNGDFRRYLLQPVRFSQLFFSTILGEKLLTWLLLALAYFLLQLWKGPELVVIPHWSFYFFLAFSIALSWMIYFTFILLTFWLHEVKFMIIAFNISMGLFAGTVLPLDWLPLWIQKVSLYTPLRVMGDLPMRAAFSRLDSAELLTGFLVSFFWIGLFGFLNKTLFLFGVRRYESFGG